MTRTGRIPRSFLAIAPFRPRLGAKLGLVLGACALMPFAASAQEAADTAEEAATPAAPVIEPEAISALDRMAAALQTLTSFEVKSDVTTDVVLEDGQKIEFGGTLDIEVARPDAFKVVADSDTRTREMYYDGAKFTIYSPKLGFYASFDAPATIGMTLDKARTEFGIEVPLADLFTWGTDQTVRARVQQAMVVRPETITGRTCMHYAFRQEKVDWQVWIEDSGKMLPCKIVITSRVDPAMPQYTAVLHWDIDTPVDKASLAFAPPADAHEIAIEEVDDQEESEQ